MTRVSKSYYNIGLSNRDLDRLFRHAIRIIAPPKGRVNCGNEIVTDAALPQDASLTIKAMIR